LALTVNGWRRASERREPAIIVGRAKHFELASTHALRHIAPPFDGGINEDARRNPAQHTRRPQ